MLRHLEGFAHLRHRLPVRQRDFRLTQLGDDLLRPVSSTSHAVPLSLSSYTH